MSRPLSQVFDENQLKNVVAGLLNEGTVVRLKLSGNSMYPFLREGDLSQIERVDPLTLKRGQVVVFSSGDHWIAHRLISIAQQPKGLTFLAQGDSHPKADPPFLVSDYLGVIQHVERNGVALNLKGLQLRFLSFLMVSVRPLPQMAVRLSIKIRRRLFNASLSR